MRTMRRLLGCTAAALALSIGGAPPARADDPAMLFPADIRPLLDGVPGSVVEALWAVRQSAPDTIVWADGGGALAAGERAAYWNAWEKITGWKVRPMAPPPQPAALQAAVQAGSPQYDVFENGSVGNASLEASENLLQPLDPELFEPIFAMYPKGYLHTPYWAEYSKVIATVIWNTKTWPLAGKHPTTTLDLFNTKEFPGKRCLYKGLVGGGTLEYPLLADGVQRDQLFPLDVGRALGKLDTIRSDIVWWGAGAQSVQFILDGECDIGMTWHGRVADLKRDNPGTAIGEAWQDTMLVDVPFSIVKGARHMQAAQSALAYALTPKPMCALLNTVGYGIPYDDACLNDFARDWGVSAEHMKSGIAVNNDWYAKNYSGAIERFNGWLAKP